jgi:hypothetical protein
MAVSAAAEVAHATATIPSHSAPGQPISRVETVEQHRIELVWDGPVDGDAITMLSVYFDGEPVDIGLMAGDTFGLLMELADHDEQAILPPWADDQE